jgi:hypothetical protein
MQDALNTSGHEGGHGAVTVYVFVHPQFEFPQLLVAIFFIF